uniref:Uncharacterized protein n=1 Tax=Anguilla anguilla TaxID=7936 RepID=A0A0E9UTG5_ANGAN
MKLKRLSLDMLNACNLINLLILIWF